MKKRYIDNFASGNVTMNNAIQEREPLTIVVRTGIDSVMFNGEFADEIEQIERIPIEHDRWQSIRYDNKRYQLFGGVRTPYFICLNNPIMR